MQVGVFTMDESGLNPVANPSALFLSDRSQPSGVSSAVSVTMEGTRPLLLEIQALCTPVHEKVAYPTSCVSSFLPSTMLEKVAPCFLPRLMHGREVASGAAFGGHETDA